MATSASDNLKAVQSRINAAARGAGREPSDIKLIAVSKGKGAEDVQTVLAAGHLVFGENRVQEAKAKFKDIKPLFPDIELHLIGSLQTNKAEEAVKLFDVIHTMDRPRLAEALASACRKTGRNTICYIEVNIGNEPQKAGIKPADTGSFLEFCRNNCRLDVRGLMCIPPQHEDPTPYFAQLRGLAQEHQLSALSMGMSGDFEAAIRAGATAVRVGTAIFGARDKPY